ncbi:MAG: hypothetical protein QME58_08710 [Bacteroidota bacterium]|nr:hypothetical protein [Bacteroidota bacterium]
MYILMNTMYHIDEKILELYVLEAAEVIDKKEDIEKHIKNCQGCRKLFEEMESYYAEVDKSTEERLQKNIQLITLRNLIFPKSKLGNRTLDQIPKTYPVRVVSFIIRHPIASFMSLAAAFVFGLLLMTPKTDIKDEKPEYSRAKDEFLVVYNKNGEELWRKHIGIGYDLEKLRVQEPGFDPDNYLQTVDVDGDGKKEVVAIFGMLSEWQPKNAIYCYTPDGDERWTYKFNRQMTFGNNVFDDTYQFGKFLVGDFEKNGSFEIIAYIHHGGWYPTAIIKIDAAEGKLLNEYWHSGNIHGLINRDLNNDGIEEIIATGENNGFNLASLFVLDPLNFQGHSPAPEEYTPKDISIGNEKYYLLINRTDFKKYASHPRNRVRGMRFTSDGDLIVSVTEEIDKTEYSCIYLFDQTLKCISIDGEDKFVTLHNKYVADGRLSKKLDEQYFEDLRKGIRYWDGEKFVNYTTMNKKYLTSQNNKLLP